MNTCFFFSVINRQQETEELNMAEVVEMDMGQREAPCL